MVDSFIRPRKLGSNVRHPRPTRTMSQYEGPVNTGQLGDGPSFGQKQSPMTTGSLQQPLTMGSYPQARTGLLRSYDPSNSFNSETISFLGGKSKKRGLFDRVIRDDTPRSPRDFGYVEDATPRQYTGDVPIRFAAPTKEIHDREIGDIGRQLEDKAQVTERYAPRLDPQEIGYYQLDTYPELRGIAQDLYNRQLEQGPLQMQGFNQMRSAEARAAQMDPNVLAQMMNAQAAQARGSMINREGINQALMSRATQGRAGQIGLDPFYSALSARATQAGTSDIDQAAIQQFLNAQAGTTQGANINLAQQGQTRDVQNELVAQLQERAQGGGSPSVAELQLKAGTDQAMQQALALSASQQGVAPGQALRAAQGEAARLTQQSALQTSMLRAQEQQAAQQQLGALTGQVRGQDIGLATQQAGFQQQAGLANQAAQNQLQLAGLQAGTQQAQAQAQLNQGVNLQNAAAQNQLQTLGLSGLQSAAMNQAGLNQAANLQNAAAQNQLQNLGLGSLISANQMEASFGQQAGLQNAAAQNQLQGFQLAQMGDFARQNAAYQQQANMANAGYLQQANAMNTQLGFNAAQQNFLGALTNREQQVAAGQGYLQNITGLDTTQLQGRLLANQDLLDQMNAYRAAISGGGYAPSGQNFWQQAALAGIGGGTNALASYLLSQ